MLAPLYICHVYPRFINKWRINMIKIKSCNIRMSLFVMLISLAPQVYADPPPWAPTHGWRKQHDAYYTGYTGSQWSNIMVKYFRTLK